MAVFLQEKIILILFQFIFLKNLALAVSQYSMKDSNSESFLEANFTGTSDHIFPKNLEIIVYLSRMSGLLFYSIDKNLNQLIVNLQDTKIPTIKIEFRIENYILSLNDLCKCKLNSCLYEKLSLRFQIINSIDIQCNGRQVNEHSFTNNKFPNNDYPIPSFYKTEITAFLWLINTPSYQNKDRTVHPNPEYFTGCIYNVTYDNVSVQLNGSLKNCAEQCKSQTCNDGECIETYNLQSICNCTGAFLNGDYCDKALTGPGEYDFQFQFKIMKISLKLESNSAKQEILRLSSSAGYIAIYLRSSNELFVTYYQNHSKSNSMSNEHTRKISKNIIENINYILLLEFDDKSIIIKMKHNNSWIESSINIGKIVSGIEFHKIHCCLTDVAYKISENEIGWLPAKLERNLRGQMNVLRKQKSSCFPPTDEPPLDEKFTFNPTTDDPDLDEDTSIIDIVICILAAVIFASWGILYIYYRKCFR